jgi:glycosyltransferase involved in cell wall biosynthesis
VVYDVHENVAEDIRTKAYLWRPVRPLLAVGYRWAEAILMSGVPTVHVIESIARRYRQPRVVVRNLPRMADVPPRKRPWQDGTARLVHSGIVSRQRGIMTLVKAAEVLAGKGYDFEMRLVGPICGRGLEADLGRAIADAGLGSRVLVMGAVSFGAALAEVAEADVGLCVLAPEPNTLNSLPNKLFEYMACRLPVVASDFPAWRPYVSGLGAGLQVDATSPAAIADAMAWLLDHPAERREMGRRGREAVEREFCWELEGRKLLAFYRMLLDRNAYEYCPG